MFEYVRQFLESTNHYDVKNAFRLLASGENSRHIFVDLHAIVYLNVFIFDPLYRAGVDPECNLEGYRSVIQEVLDVCKEDTDEIICRAKKLGESFRLPNLGKYFRPTQAQNNILCHIDRMYQAKDPFYERIKFIVILALESTMGSINSIHATILEHEFTEIQKMACTNNVFAERAFSRFDFISRCRRNLSFIHRETLTMVSCNHFWPWFDSLPESYQVELLKETGAQQERLRSLNLNLEAEEAEIRQTYLAEKAQKEQDARNKKMAQYNEIKADLCDCIPRTECEYMSCGHDWLQINHGKTEDHFLRLLLKYMKLQLQGRKIAANKFTMSSKGVPCSTAQLRAKLFFLLKL